VRNWALEHGYDLGRGVGETPLHPVSSISWHDAVKFCNSASERAGRVPVYRVAGEVYRTGINNNVTMDLVANGYRLPSEAEWEYACRAGTTTPYYWGNESKPGPENPYAWQTTHKSKGDEVSPGVVGLKKPNAFGLFDTSGNVSEWCWDWFSPEYDRTRMDTPLGPDRGNWRILRGGSVALDSFVESGYRNFVSLFHHV
jgi:sulfatase modifying factor 1